MQKKREYLDFLNKTKYAQYVICLSLIVQVFVYIYLLVSKQMHVDETMLLLNARSIADNATDILGKRLPAYFDTWLIGGQSPVPTYLAAAIIKLFGFNPWLVRLVISVVSALSLIAFYSIIKQVFKNNVLLQNCIITFAALSPWRFLQSAWMIDYAFMVFFATFAIYFLIKAAYGKKVYINCFVSMLFFALGFYSYISSILAIPVFLLFFFGIMILNKKMKFRYGLWSFCILTVLLIPYIITGLVFAGYLDNTEILGITFSKTELFAKQKAIDFSIINNLSGAFVIAFIPDLLTLLGMKTEGYNICIGAVSYGHIISSICVFVALIFALIKRKSIFKKSNVLPLTLLFSFGVSFLVYSMSVYYENYGNHRYSFYYFFFNIISGIGAYCIIKYIVFIKPLINKFTVTLLIVLSLIQSAYGIYRFANTDSVTTGSLSIFEYCDAIENNNCKSMEFVSRETEDATRFSVFMRYRYYDKKDELSPLKEELTKEYNKENNIVLKRNNPNITVSKSVVKFDKDAYIIISKDFENEYKNIDKSGYDIKNNGNCYLLLKTEKQ